MSVMRRKKRVGPSSGACVCDRQALSASRTRIPGERKLTRRTGRTDADVAVGKYPHLFISGSKATGFPCDKVLRAECEIATIIAFHISFRGTIRLLKNHRYLRTR